MLNRHSSYEFDDYREEALAFWSGLLPWPASTEELLFIPEAVNEVGFKLFPGEWNSSTFCDVFTPELHYSDDFVYDEDSYFGRYLKIIVDDVEHRHGLSLDPKEAYLRFVASDKADTRDRIMSVARILLKAFRKGDIKTFKQRIGGGVPFVEMQPIEWTRDDAIDWFALCHDGHTKLPADCLRRRYPLEALPSFIFVSCSSFYSFLNYWGESLENYLIDFKAWIDQTPPQWIRNLRHQF